MKNGSGTLASQFPGLIHRFERYDIDPTKTPILIYPTLHYQNGGIQVDSECRSNVPGLWACGEVTGGLHGKNRLMGNSLLDITVFGRRSAQSVLDNIPERGAVTLTNLQKFRTERKEIKCETVSPKFFPEASGMKLATTAKAEDKQEKKTTDFEPRNPFNF